MARADSGCRRSGCRRSGCRRVGLSPVGASCGGDSSSSPTAAAHFLLPTAGYHPQHLDHLPSLVGKYRLDAVHAFADLATGRPDLTVYTPDSRHQLGPEGLHPGVQVGRGGRFTGRCEVGLHLSLQLHPLELCPLQYEHPEADGHVGAVLNRLGKVRGGLRQLI